MPAAVSPVLSPRKKRTDVPTSTTPTYATHLDFYHPKPLKCRDRKVAPATDFCGMTTVDTTAEFKSFRRLGIIEGISFLVILGVTMPLKYAFDITEPNKYAGMLHGALFIFYCFGALQFYWQRNWPLWKLLVLWLAAIIPFGTFLADWKLLAGEE